MSKLQRLWPLAMIAALVALFLASYGGAYLFMSVKVVKGTNGAESFTARTYPTEWHVVLFKPAAKVESAILNRYVYVEYTP